MMSTQETAVENGPEIPIEIDDSEEEFQTLLRMPSLAKPFAAFGAAAGLFAILGLGSFREAAREVSPLTPMIATALVGAIAGTVLRRWQHLHTPLQTQKPMLGREAMIMRVGAVVACAGMASGGIVGLTTWGAEGFARFAVGGALVGLLFLPSCLVVFDAARRAGRGRHGSLVAGTDRRTVASTVLGGIAFAAATQVPTLLNVEVSNELDPIVQAALSIITCLAATIGIVVLQRRDRKARAALEGFKRDASWLDRVESDDLVDESATVGKEGRESPVDLGIGADRWARNIDNHYRTSGRAEVLVKGSINDAAAAFDECVRRRHRSLLVAVASLTAVTLSVALRISVFVR